MLVRALAYDIKVQYLKSNDMFLADTLSRAFLPYTSVNDQEESEIINSLKYLVMPHVRNRKIRQHTNDDLALQLLKQTIQEGWPDHQSALYSGPLGTWKVTLFTSNRHLVTVDRHLLLLSNR